MPVRALAATAAALVLAPVAASAAPAPWSPSGPTPGGQVDRIVVDPANAARAVAIVTTPDVDDPTSQLYETLDAGRSWTAGATALPNLRRVSATTPLAIAGGAVWVADGSGVCSGASAAGPFACSATAQDFGSLTAVTGQAGVLVLANGSEVRRSVDGGATWTQPAGFVPRALATGDPTTAGRVFAVGSGARVMQSVDGGVTWTTNGQDPACEPSALADHAPGLLADPSAAARLYSRGTGTALCRSVDGGATWTAAAWPEAGLGEAPFGSPAPGLAVTATGALVAGTHAGVQRSTDGGATWSATAGVGPRAIGPLAAGGSTAYAGTARRGVFASDDDGVTWRPASGGLPAVPLRAIDALLTPGRDLVYAYSTTELVRSEDAGASWSARGGDPAGGAVEPLAVDPVDGTLYAYASGPGSAPGRLVASTDGGLTFATRTQGAPFQRLPLDFHVSRSRPRVLTLRAEVGGRLWRSTDDGQSWRQAGPLRGFSDLAFDTADPQRIAATVRVAGGNVLYVSANGGGSWRRALPGLVGDDVEADAVATGELVVDAPVPRRSTNFGRTFTARAAAFPFEHRQLVGALEVGQVANTSATRRPGLFRNVPNRAVVSSADGGRSWTVLDVPANVRQRQVEIGATVLLAQGRDTDLLRSPLPTAHARLLAPPRLVGPTGVGKRVRCVGARFAGATASTSAVGLPGGGVVGAGSGFTIPRLGSPRLACHTVARTPAGLAFASSAPVRVGSHLIGGGGEGEG